MLEPVLDAHIPEFDARNNFLYFLLGVVSVSQAAVAVLEGAGAPWEVPDPDAGAPADLAALRELLR